MKRLFSCGLTVLALAGCFPAEIKLDNAMTKSPTVLFYPGGTAIDDLLIVDSVNYFGKAQYQIDDPMSDIGFRLKDGRRIQAECILEGKSIIDEPECKRYEVYRSSFEPIPVGTQADRPSLF